MGAGLLPAGQIIREFWYEVYFCIEHGNMPAILNSTQHGSWPMFCRVPFNQWLGGTLQLKVNQFMKDRVHRYSVQCIPRDGISDDAIQVDLQRRPMTIRGQNWLVIGKAETVGAGGALPRT